MARGETPQVSSLGVYLSGFEPRGGLGCTTTPVIWLRLCWGDSRTGWGVGNFWLTGTISATTRRVAAPIIWITTPFWSAWIRKFANSVTGSWESWQILLLMSISKTIWRLLNFFALTNMEVKGIMWKINTKFHCKSRFVNCLNSSTWDLWVWTV